MDYRKFLSRTETLVLPYFGGPTVDARDRRLRVSGEFVVGWWEFEVEGRRAKPTRRAEQPDLSELESVRGHFANGWLFLSGRVVERIALEPADEPEPLTPCTARRWHGGELLLDCVEFEDEAEETARVALEQGEPLGATKGVSPSLRAAFGYASVAVAGARAQVPVSPREAMARVHDIAAGGRVVADRIVAEIAARRLAYLARQAQRAHEQRITQVAGSVREVAQHERGRSPQDLVEVALLGAGARMLRCRRLADQQLEVAFSFMGERFISVVHASTLNVHDAGICLDGADSDLTLDSLPSAIREAIDTGQLYITRH